jgi:NitT/TauT family transport system ATP-binding protein
MNDVSCLYYMNCQGFSYPSTEHTILQDFRLELGEGELVGIMGPNGCGKSTLLQLISGDLPLEHGRIKGSITPREIAFIYQDYRRSLFPWKTAIENIRLPIRIRNQNHLAEDNVQHLLEDFSVRYDLGKLPRFLSGGEQQKLCVLRALAESPRLLLLDESCSAMDYASRLHFLRTLRQNLNRARVAALLVSHSAEETLLFSDRVLLLSPTGTLITELTGCQSEDSFAHHLRDIHAHFLA